MSAELQVFSDALAGLGAELAMLDAVAEGAVGRSYLIWEAAAAGLVLPARFTRTAAFPTAERSAAAAGWPVTSRATGGGITPQGPGVINLALAFRPDAVRSVAQSYRAICDPLVATFAALGLTASAGAVSGSFCDGDYNLEIGGRKIVGTAQRWRKGAVLVHALVLIDLDLARTVAAAQGLADDLGLGDRYRPDAHVTLAGLLPAQTRAPEAFTTTLAEIVRAAGYRDWAAK